MVFLYRNFQNYSPVRKQSGFLPWVQLKPKQRGFLGPILISEASRKITTFPTPQQYQPPSAGISEASKKITTFPTPQQYQPRLLWWL